MGVLECGRRRRTHLANAEPVAASWNPPPELGKKREVEDGLASVGVWREIGEVAMRRAF